MWNVDAKFAKEVSAPHKKARCRCNLTCTGGVKSICKFKEKQGADTLVPKRASATVNI